MKNVNIKWKYIWIDRQEKSEKFDSKVITNINFDIVKNSILKYRIHYRKKRNNGRITNEFFGGNITNIDSCVLDVFSLMLEASLNADDNTSYNIIIDQTCDGVDKIAVERYVYNNLDKALHCKAFIYKHKKKGAEK